LENYISQDLSFFCGVAFRGGEKLIRYRADAGYFNAARAVNRATSFD
jgi:hypothetical protein